MKYVEQTYLDTTMPLPARPLQRKPALTTVKIASPFASLITDTGIIVSNPFSISSLTLRKHYKQCVCIFFFLFLLMNCSRIRAALAHSSDKLPRIGLLKFPFEPNKTV